LRHYVVERRAAQALSQFGPILIVTMLFARRLSSWRRRTIGGQVLIGRDATLYQVTPAVCESCRTSVSLGDATTETWLTPAPTTIRQASPEGKHLPALTKPGSTA
jgi:hypothetical protein